MKVSPKHENLFGTIFFGLLMLSFLLFCNVVNLAVLLGLGASWERPGVSWKGLIGSLEGPGASLEGL